MKGIDMPSNADKKQLSEKQDFEITEEMESNVQAKLDAMNQPDEADLEGVPRLEKKEKEEENEDKDDKEDVTEDDDTEKVTEDEDKDDKEDVTEDDSENEDTDGDDKEVKDDGKKEYVLPENYYQAMRHVGWEPERIKEIFEQDPEQALKDFKFYHDSQNYVTQQTSDLGRAKLAQTQRATEEATKKEEKPEYKGIDLKAIQDEFGEDSPAAVVMIKAMNESNKLLFDEVQTLKAVTQEQTGPTDEQRAIWNEIATYFDSDNMKSFSKFYGTSEKDKKWDQSLTGAEWKARMNVIQEADAYYAGMELQGKEVSYTDALQRAHLVVAAPIQESIIREQLHGKIKKRSKGITVKSSGRVAAKDASKKGDKSEKGFIEKTKQRIKKITGKMPES